MASSSSGKIGNVYAAVSPKLDDGWKGRLQTDIGSSLGSASSKAGESSGALMGSSLLKGATKAFAALGIADALLDVGKAAFQGFADSQQLTGGVETIFKDSADMVKQYADEAASSAGMSANQYMETVTGFSASLIQSLGGDTEKAAQLANMAIIDMSDNSNKMGTDMQSIQNAYQGFAKQNYTMLDNLKLGYGGTKSEMERLIKTANELREEQGLNSDLTIDSYSDVVEAIHTVQENMEITGTTAQEAASTVSGSVNTMKASWNNWLAALGTGDPETIKLKTQELMGSAQTVVENALPVIGSIVSGFVSSLPTILESAFKGVVWWLGTLPQKFVDACGDAWSWLYNVGCEIMDGLWQGLQDWWGGVASWFWEKMEWIGEAAARANEVQSPSKLFYRIGAYDMEGLGEGLEEGFGKYVEPALSMDMRGAFEAGQSPLGYGESGDSVVNIYIDGARVNDDEAISARFYDNMRELFALNRMSGVSI